MAWYDQNSGGSTNPVKIKQANEYALYDMSGNVWEWVLDKWHDDYEGAPTMSNEAWGGAPECNQVCDIGSARHVNHGGGWCNDAEYLWVSHRNRFSPDNRSYALGFRLRRTR